ncbi:Histone deacetylase interacting domain [Arabidopsis suecica]|uniref:Histone deacetylase interacting domain n=1 Tax=Arabidopsis suecica TaxID=45249 RepID=A0A8T2BAY0_ARASU|nr:Histone deacetylase interacting domain [Arabidopsis suecica]
MADTHDEMIKTIGMKTLSPWEQIRLRSLTQEFNFGILGNTELTRDLTRLKDNLLARKIDDEKPDKNPILNDPKVLPRIKIRVKLIDNLKEDVERKKKSHLEAKQKLTELLKATEKRLSRSELRVYTNLCRDFRSHKIAYSEFVTSLLRLVEKYKNLYQRFVEIPYGDKEDEAGETLTRVKVDENPQETELDKINLEGKRKRGMLLPEESNQPERPLKKRRTSELLTPNYKPIPKAKQRPVSSSVLNNTCAVKRYNFQGCKNLTDIEEDRYKCEDQMFEADVLMGYLRTAVENAEDVMRGEMVLGDLGPKFYRCVEMMYGGDMFEIVTENHQRAFPVILNRLNQKLREVTALRESLIPVWKQTIEKLSRKQSESIAQDCEVKKTKI